MRAKILKKSSLKSKAKNKKNQDKELDDLFLELTEKEKIDCCGEDRYGI